MHYGYRIVEDMIDGLQNWMADKGFSSLEAFQGLSLPRVSEWKNLNLNYKIVARIHEEKCIGCDLCYTACWDGAHQCIHLDRVSGPVDGHVEVHAKPAQIEAASRSAITMTPIPKLDRGKELHDGPYGTPLARIPRVDETECVGCNLCSLVCPVESCITMEEVDLGLPRESWEERSAHGANQNVMATVTNNGGHR
jgi:dihydropyrimidine dehydrogenase (NAD+) subunit PreA